MPQYSMHFLNALLIVLVLIPPFQFLAQRIGLVDVPRGRKMHDGAVPLTGGIAMFVAFAFPLLTLNFPQGGFLLAGLALLVATGVVDDLFELGPWAKLGAQVVATLILIVPGTTIVDPGTLIREDTYTVGGLAGVFTVFLILGLTNAFNMIDGIDGLAGGAAAVTLAGLAVAAGLSGKAQSEVTLLLLLAAVLGFLGFNLRHRWRTRAAVFMGDAGSLMLGGAISFFIVKLSAGERATAVPLPVLLWMVAIPAFDMTILMVRRLAHGQNPMVGDRRHLHHLLLQAGETPQSATALIVASSGALCAVGILGWRMHVPPMVMLFALSAPFSLQLYFVCHGWKRLARLRGRAVDIAMPDPIGHVEDQAV